MLKFNCTGAGGKPCWYSGGMAFPLHNLYYQSSDVEAEKLGASAVVDIFAWCRQLHAHQLVDPTVEHTDHCWTL